MNKNTGTQPAADGVIVSEFPGEERIDMISRNGDNDGNSHYDHIPDAGKKVSDHAVDDTAIVKQARYMIGGGRDQIDRWASERTHDEFRIIMYAMIEKYQCRLGKKAPIHEETAKMLDYMDRWHSYEMEWAND